MAPQAQLAQQGLKVIQDHKDHQVLQDYKDQQGQLVQLLVFRDQLGLRVRALLQFLRQ